MRSVSGIPGSRSGLFLSVCLAFFVYASQAWSGDAEVAGEIDRLIQESNVGPVAARCSDEDFVRRVYLDLWGMIPSSEEALAFLGDPSPAKRTELVNRLVAGPQFARHMAYVFDAWLLERRPDKGIGRDEWQEYLFQSFLEKKPYDQLMRELLAADGSAESRVRAKFLLDRDCDSPGLVRDVDRILFGRDIQCAQCHDHPLIDDYLQEEFYGLMALLQRTYLFTDVKNNNTLYVGERAEGLPEYHSVFVADSVNRIAIPVVPGKLPVPPFLPEPGAEYVVAPADNIRPIPRHSARHELARLATVDNVLFDRAAANRLWKQMFGKGLVEPVDMQHSDNNPSHPELLDFLARTLRERGYDVARFLAILAQSQAYQRSLEPPAPAEAEAYLDEARQVQQQESQRAEAVATELEIAKQEVQAALSQKEEVASKAQATLRTFLETRQQYGQSTGEAAQLQATVDQLTAQLADVRAKTQLVTTAADQAAAAAQGLQDDPQIKAAADGLAASAAQRKQALAALEQQWGQQQAALQTAVQARDALKQKLTAVMQDVSATYGPLPAAYEHWHRSLQTRDALKNRQSVARRRAGLAGSLVQTVVAHQQREAAAASPELQMSAADQDQDYARQSAELTQAWCDQFVLAQPRHLSPEQLAWSVSQATGQMRIDQQAVQQEWTQQHPAPENLDPTSDKERQTQREQDVRRLFTGRMAGLVGQFSSLFGGAAGQPQTEFFASADQALFLSNSGAIHQLLVPQGNNLADQLLKETDPSKEADALYVHVLSRHPSDAEREMVQAFLSQHGDQRLGAIQELVWGLLASAEFRFYR